MQSENKYIGDDKFQKFLDHYACPTPLEIVKFRFAGAICSPNFNLRPTDVISSLFPREAQPRLVTKAEAELFFKFFMGLWDEMFAEIKQNNIKFNPVANTDRENLVKLCMLRANQLENGFNEGFWGGCDTLNIPNHVADLIGSMADLADVYGVLAKKLKNADNKDDILQVIINTDKTVEKSFKVLIDNFVLPNVANLQRSVN